MPSIAVKMRGPPSAKLARGTLTLVGVVGVGCWASLLRVGSERQDPIMEGEDVWN
jgi:hypothetical protein